MGELGEPVGVGRVRTDALDSRALGSGAAAGDDPYVVPGVDEQVCDRAADRARSDDDVLSHGILRCVSAALC